MAKLTLKQLLLKAQGAKALALTALEEAKQARELILKAKTKEEIVEESNEEFEESEEIEEEEDLTDWEKEEKLIEEEKSQDFDYVKSEGWTYERSKKSKKDKDDFDYASEDNQTVKEEESILEISEGIEIPEGFDVLQWEDMVLNLSIDREDCVLDKRQTADFNLNGFDGLFDEELALRLEKAAAEKGKKYFEDWKRIGSRYIYFVNNADSIFKRKAELSSLGERKLKVAYEMISGGYGRLTFESIRLGKKGNLEDLKETWNLFAEVVEELDEIRI